ncbi:MAG: hypothetical protein K0R27_231 [Xanthobacteraceae bacterium]|nr:hypothetical protein [Xanthobacteraceae bacterium]
MHMKAISILVLSGLIAGAAISNADAQSRRVPLPPEAPAIVDPWLAANGETAIELQSGYDQGNHTHEHHDMGGHGGGHGGRR